MEQILAISRHVDFWRALHRCAQGLLRRALAHREARRERAQLLALSDRELRDIGLSRLEAVRAAREPGRF